MIRSRPRFMPAVGDLMGDGPVLGLRYLRTADDQVTLLVSRQCG